MLINSIITFLEFTFVVGCSAFTLDLSEPIRLKMHSQNSVDSEYSTNNDFPGSEFLNQRRPNSSASSSWEGWNWKKPSAPTNFVTGKSLERRSDWTWKDTPESEALEDKTLHLQVLEDESHGDRRKHRWPHDDFLYDPYTFQHQNRLGQAQTQLLVHNQLDPYSIRPHHQPYEWQDLKPLMDTQRPLSHHVHQSHHYDPHAHRPPHHFHHGGPDFGSAVSATGTAATTLGHETIAHAHAHASSHTHGFPIPGGWKAETNRKYGPHFHYPPHPPDYKRKRYKLEVHPGFIAAPIAGLAAFGVAHAFTSQPLLFELGLVDKKKGFPRQHHHHHHVHPVTVTPPCIGNPECYHIHSHNNYPHSPPPSHHLHPSYHPQHHPRPHPEFSTLLPHHVSHPPQSINHHQSDHSSLHPTDRPTHHNVEQESKPWWSPLAAMIPRLRRNDFERD